jgi:hypothetical protein
MSSVSHALTHTLTHNNNNTHRNAHRHELLPQTTCNAVRHMDTNTHHFACFSSVVFWSLSLRPCTLSGVWSSQHNGQVGSYLYSSQLSFLVSLDICLPRGAIGKAVVSYESINLANSLIGSTWTTWPLINSLTHRGNFHFFFQISF